MAELHTVDLNKLRELCGDNLAKGEDIFQAGALSDTWRSRGVLHASVAGSAKEPYVVGVAASEDGSFTAECTCPAARRQKVCKHAVAVLLAWGRKPDQFVLRPEMEAPEGARPRVESDVKRLRQPRADRRELVKTGLDKAEALLVDLCRQGLLSLTQDQVAMIGTLAETAEAHKLRRLARQIAEIQRVAGQIQEAGQGAPDEGAWARLLCDTWLVLSATRRALEREDESNRAEVEDLIGKTWLEKDLRRVTDRRLVELAYQTLVLTSGFRVETSFLLDLGDGALYTEKQITPLKLKDIPRKPSYPTPLRVATAGIYPGFAPLRIKLIEHTVEETGGDAWDRVIALAETSAANLRQQLQQATSNLVAPQETFCLFRPASLLAGDALFLVGADGKAIPVGHGSHAPRFALQGALARWRLGAVFCRLYFAEDALVAEPLSVIAGDADGWHLVRLTA